MHFAVLVLLLVGRSVSGLYTHADADIEVEGCRRNGECECSINGTWTKYQEYLDLQIVSLKLSDMETSIKMLDLPQIVANMHNITERMAALVARVDKQSMSLSIREMISLKKTAEILVALVEEVQASGNNDTKLKELKAEIDALLVIIDNLWGREPSSQDREFKKELEKVRARLTSCQANITWSAFKGDTLPIDFDYSNWCDSNELASIGSPVVHRWVAYDYGAWFKDPLPQTEEERTEIYFRWYRRYSYSDTLYKYANYSKFIAEKDAKIVDTEQTYGLGYVVYDHSWYWSTGTTMYTYNFKLGTSQQRTVTYSHVDYIDQAGLYTDIDFKVDEYGLWAIMPTTENNDKLVIYKVDPKDLSFLETYVTNRHKKSVCAVFMACGKMYTLDKCTDRLKAGPGSQLTQYVYDTRTREEDYNALSIASRFGHVWSLNYNPRERTIFAWDNQHLVTYPVWWNPKSKK